MTEQNGLMFVPMSVEYSGHQKKEVAPVTSSTDRLKHQVEDGFTRFVSTAP